MSKGLGALEREILDILADAGDMESVTRGRLVAELYHDPCVVMWEPTKSQVSSVNRAVRSLISKGWLAESSVSCEHAVVLVKRSKWLTTRREATYRARPVSAGMAARLGGVTARGVLIAEAIQRDAPHLEAEVMAGTLSIDAALRERDSLVLGRETGWGAAYKVIKQAALDEKKEDRRLRELARQHGVPLGDG